MLGRRDWGGFRYPILQDGILPLGSKKREKVVGKVEERLHEVDLGKRVIRSQAPMTKCVGEGAM